MLEVYSWLNNREKAIIIWVLILLLALLFYKDLRTQLISIIKEIVTSSLGTVLLACTAYTMVIIYFLQEIGYWEMPLAKDALVWLFGFAFISVFKVNDQKNKSAYFKTIVVDSIKLIAIIQFVTGVYVLSFFGEMVFIPVFVFLLMMIVFSENMEKEDPKYSKTTTLFNFFLVAILGYVLYKFAYSLITDPNELLSFIKLKEFTLPIILTISFLPMLYGIAFYMFYDSFSRRLYYKLNKDEKLIRYAKLKLVIKSKFNTDKLRELESRLTGTIVESKQELDLRLAS